MAGLMRACCLAMIGLSPVADTVRASQPADGRAFTAPSMNPIQFLFVSSPTEKKVVWTSLSNFQSNEGRTFALVDTGLTEPKGLALDHKNGVIYIADPGAKKIFSFKLLIDLSGSQPKVLTTGIKLTVCQGFAFESVTIDEDGNLFFTAADSSSINKISTKVLEKIRLGEFTASALKVVSEKSMETQQASSSKMSAIVSADALPTDPPPTEPQILSMYEGGLNPHVSKPGFIWAEGEDLFWVNQEAGTTAGTVVKGMVNPKSPPNVSSSRPAPFPAVALTNASAGAYGLAKGKGNMFFTHDGSVAGTGAISMFLLKDPDTMVDVADTLAEPRGIVFDGDSTVYVADSVGGDVWSFPAGRVMHNAPLALTVHIEGAYGVAMLSSTDPCMQSSQITDADNEGLAIATKASEGKAVSHLQFLKSSSLQKQGLSLRVVMLATASTLLALLAA